jgi:hypothetical protein
MVPAQRTLVHVDNEDGMAKKQTPKPRQPLPPEPAARPAVTAERFTRLFRMMRFLGEEARTREWLTQELDLDVRGFYRDLELLRSVGISVTLGEAGYVLGEPIERALARLPFPDPHLTLGEMRQLARGRTATHRRLQGLIDELGGGAGST